MTYKGIPLTELLLALIGLVTTLIAAAQRKVAAAEEGKNAYARLGVIALNIVADLWTSLDETYRKDMVDGVLDRDLYRKIIAEKIEKYTSKEELEKLAVAAKLPVPGIIAWLAEFAIDRILAAHNPENPKVSEAHYSIDATVEDHGG